MMQSLADAGFQTMIFSIILGVVFLACLRFRKERLGFTHEVTNELKGFAILTIILGHIGYFLFTDHNFLFPLSTISGVGVDMFFLLSGYGLAISAMKKNHAPREFYKRRIGKIFVPLWIMLVLLLILDAWLLRLYYDWPTIVRSFLGIFPSADIYQDINSPLWYLTPLLFYYLIFPWFFKPKYAYWSALAIGLLGYLLLMVPWPITEGVRNLYSLHYIAFPLGVGVAALNHSLEQREHRLLKWLSGRKLIELLLRYAFLGLMGLVFWYTATAGGSGIMAQLASVICAISVLMIFVCVKLRLKMFEVLGLFSYEIYLIHWPLLYRFDFIYRFLPAGFGTALYLGVLLLLAYLMRRFIERKKT